MNTPDKMTKKTITSCLDLLYLKVLKGIDVISKITFCKLVQSILCEIRNTHHTSHAVHQITDVILFLQKKACKNEENVLSVLMANIYKSLTQQGMNFAEV